MVEVEGEAETLSGELEPEPEDAEDPCDPVVGTAGAAAAPPLEISVA